MGKRTTRNIGWLGSLPGVALFCLGPVRLDAEPRQLEIDRARSFIVATAHKGGLMSFAAGHDHGILAREWLTTGCIDRQNLGASEAKLIVRTGSLEIDSKEARSKAGLKSAGPSPKDIEEIQRKMLDSSNLAAQVHPEIYFTTNSIERQGPARYLLKGTVVIRGVTRGISVPIEISPGSEGGLRITGSFAVAQTDFGIKPVSISGLVTVKDNVDIRFELYARPAGPCLGPSSKGLQ